MKPNTLLRQENDKSYTHLSKDDRNEIAPMRRNGYSVRDIATTFSCGVGTISGKLNRNKVAGIYCPWKAHTKCQVRLRAAKFQGMALVDGKALLTRPH